MGKYDVRAKSAARNFAKKNLPHKVYRQLNKPGGLLRKERIGGVKHISTSKEAKQVLRTVLEEAQDHELMTEKKERPLKRKIRYGRRRHMEDFLGVKEEAPASVAEEQSKHKGGGNLTRSGHLKPPSGIDGKNERLALLRAKRTGASEDDINALREAINLEQRKKSQELSQKELQAIAHKEMMRRLVKEAHGWKKKDGEEEDENDNEKHKLGSTPEAAAEEISNRQAIQRPPEVHGPPPPSAA